MDKSDAGSLQLLDKLHLESCAHEWAIRSFFVLQFATMSVWAWYCIVTIPTKTWLHWSSKQSSAFDSWRQKIQWILKRECGWIFQPVEESTQQIWHSQPPLGSFLCGPERRTMICCRKEVPGTSVKVSGPEVESEVGKQRQCNMQSGWSFDKNLELFAWNEWLFFKMAAFDNL